MPDTARLSDAKKNFLLASMPTGEFELIQSRLRPITLELEQPLYESGDRLEYVYFPTTAIIARLYEMEDGWTTEVGMIGNDGMLGIALFLGGDRMPSRAIVQTAGEAFKMKAKDLIEEFTLGGRFHDLLLRYTQALIIQISQTAVCNRLHSLEQQLCRWLLLSHDRLDSDTLVTTHRLISHMLGVRREGVTMAARKLAAKKLIKNVRGSITILDRHGLENVVCECYDVVNDEYNRLLGTGISRTFG